LSGFAKWERDLAARLEKFPWIRTAVKETYKRFIYFFYREPGFRYWLHPDVNLLTPQQWADLPDAEGEWFFGYYDRTPWSADMQWALFHHYDGKCLNIVAVDRQSGKQYSVGATAAWNWQQGSMAQWLPGTNSHLVGFNTIDDAVLGCRIFDLDQRHDRFIPWPIQVLHPNGQEALTLNYRRLSLLGPDYGYTIEAKNFFPDQALNQDGIWRVDTKNAIGSLIISLADLAAYKYRSTMRRAHHAVNHILYSPSGERFIFLHRFIGKRGQFSRLYVSNQDGSGLHLLMDDRMVSHYHWKDDNQLLVWGRTAEKGDHYYLLNVINGESSIMGEGVLDRYGDGHCSFSPDRRWIVTDTYPDRARHQRLFIFDTHSGECITLGRFFAPWVFSGGLRCDLHPRWSPDGRWISFDSAYNGFRRTFFLDIHDIVDRI
jgi:hypothetical protein